MATTTTASSVSATPPPAKLVTLRGYERLATLADHGSFKMVHVMVVRGQLDELLRHLPMALVHTFNKHPRMRATQVQGSFAYAHIQPQIQLQGIVTHRLLGIRGTSNEEERLGKWQKHIEEESNQPFNRFVQFPFFLRVWVNKENNTARFILFSDKFMSDGISGNVVFNDLLEFASQLSLANGKPLEKKHLSELPLRPSLYHAWLDHQYSAGWLKFCAKWFSKSHFKADMKTFTPKVTPRTDQNDMTMPPKCNATSVLFADGTEENFKKIWAKCDKEGVKLSHALAVAVLLGYYAMQPQAVASEAEKEQQPEDEPEAAKVAASKKADTKKEKPAPFKVRMDTLIDMRRRVEYPAPETQIGDYMTSYPFESFVRAGVQLDSVKFWDLARANKDELAAILDSYSLPMPMIFTDKGFTSKTDAKFFSEIPLRHSSTADVTLSNIGSYAHKTSHLFRTVDAKTKAPTTGTLTVESVHYSCTSPHMSSTASLYVTSVKSLSFGLAHKYDAKTGKSLLDTLVKLIERIGDIGESELLSDVVASVLPPKKIDNKLAAATA
ncbi:hypothetical protein FI667_g5895, partial [Globisporangium splendens]